jgi:nitroreductase
MPQIDLGKTIMVRDNYPIFVTEWELQEPTAIAKAPLPEAPELVRLPEPHMRGGRPLMDVMRDRHSCREFSSRPLPEQMMSDMMWCAFGVNRPATQGRTAPSAQNWQEIAIYVANIDGLFLFEASAHSLMRVSAHDIRAQTGLQSYAAVAPVDLIYVADFARAREATEEERRLYCVADTGFIAQNVYLFCASRGLATVVRGAIDRPSLTAVMRLGAHQRIILAQSVGYPAHPY